MSRSYIIQNLLKNINYDIIMVMNDLNELNDLKILVDDPVLNIPVQYCALTRDAVIRDKSL